ncbi:hypothetical protein EVA_03652 [gut metagenome]|uniref:Uncharacterized protein n=1 Tax=gut metagenome TaxID=749906 RepID=J9GYH1_9ZZZZ
MWRLNVHLSKCCPPQQGRCRPCPPSRRDQPAGEETERQPANQPAFEQSRRTTRRPADGAERRTTQRQLVGHRDGRCSREENDDSVKLVTQTDPASDCSSPVGITATTCPNPIGNVQPHPPKEKASTGAVSTK